MNHLACYLDKKKLNADLIDLLTASGRYEEAALVAYKQALTYTNVDDKVRRIKSVLQTNFHRHPDANHLIGKSNAFSRVFYDILLKLVLSEHAHLLERLSPVIASDSKNPEISSRLSQPKVPRVDGQSTVLDTLLYFSYHHHGQPENLLSSPAALKKVHKLTEKQFVWVATIARARAYAWKDCEELILTKGWLGGKKARGSIDVGEVVKLLHSNGASADVLQVFLPFVEPIEEREILAKKFNVHSVVVDVFVVNRDRLSLEAYKAKLVPQSREWFYAENALSVSNVKWKN